MTPFESACSEQQEIFHRRLAQERFRVLLAPLAAYSGLALDLTPSETRRKVVAISKAIRSALDQQDDSSILLALLHATVLEGDSWYRRHLGPLEAPNRPEAT